MLKFICVTGRNVWIAPRHVVFVRAAELPADDSPVTLIRTVDGEQFEVKGSSCEVANEIGRIGSKRFTPSV